MRCPRPLCKGFIYQDENKLICMLCGRTIWEKPEGIVKVPEDLKKKIASISG